MKRLTRHDVFDRSILVVHMEIEIENLFPHGHQINDMPLLPGIFLSNLQLERLIGSLQAADERRDRLPDLKVDGAIFDLHEDVVVEFAIERMKDVVGCSGAIGFLVPPIEMMVIDKGAI